MKLRFSLLFFLITFLILFPASWISSTRAQMADDATAVSEAEALNTLMHGRLLPTAAEQERLTANADLHIAYPAAPAELPAGILFTSTRTGAGDIFTQSAIEDDAIPLVQSVGTDATPSWSPDGTHLLFASTRNGDSEIFLRLPNGSEQQLTHNNHEDFHPSWFPDGSRILFSSNRGGSYQIYSMNRAGGDVQQVGFTPNEALFPQMSPNGSKIAFMHASQPLPICTWNWDVWIMDANGQNPHAITSHWGGDLYPRWTSGGLLVYSACRNFFSSNLYVTNLDNTVEVQLTNLSGDELHGVYGPAGNYLAFNGSVEGNVEIYLQELASGQLFNFSQNPADDYTPFWSGEIPATDCSDATAKRPLLLVTGWGGSEDIDSLLEDSQLRYFIETLSPYGYIEGCNLFYAKDTSPYAYLYNDDDSIRGRSNATIIRDNICEFAVVADREIENWSGHFDIIAHSYGGLRARAFLEREDLYGWGGDSGHPEGVFCAGVDQVFVENLFTLGTPHGGELPILPFSLLIGLDALIGDFAPDAFVSEVPALREMMPDRRYVQNLTHRQPPNVNYYLLAGDARGQTALPISPLSWLFYHWPNPTLRLFGNDFAVHGVSAHALTLFKGRYPMVYPRTVPDLHGQVPVALDPLGVIRSFVNPHNTFLEEICPVLMLEPCKTQSAGWLAPAPSVLPSSTPPISERLSNPPGAQPEAPLPIQDIVAGQITDGQTISGTFELHGTGDAQMMLSWMDDDLTFRLTNPQGRQITEEVATSDDDLTYFFFNSGVGVTASYLVSEATMGTWQYEIVADSLSQPVVYRLLLLPPTPIAVTGSTPSWSPNDRPVSITATLTLSETTPILGGEVTARIRRPDDSIDLLPLYDDGNHGDGEANDGVYGNSYEQTADGGLYGVKLTATGLYGDEAYERTAVSYFNIASASAALTGSYADRGVSKNPLGLFEQLDISANLDVVVAGTYAVAGELYAGDTFVAHATTQAALTEGTQPISLRFSGSAIRESGLNGPYTLQNVMLLDESELTNLIMAVDIAHVTQPYDANDFGLPQQLYLPTIKRK